MGSKLGGIVGIRNTWLLSALCLIFSSIAIYSGFSLSVSDWNLTHYYFSYDDEFLKRALPGETIRLFTNVDETTVRMVCVVAIIFLALVQFLSLLKVTEGWGNKDQAIAVLFFVGSPAALGHFILDFGRYDVFLYIFIVCTIFVSIMFRFWIALSALILFQYFAILTHEITIISTVPVSLLVLAALKGKETNLFGLAGAGVLLCLFSVLVFTFGGSDFKSFDSLYDTYSNRYGRNVNSGSLAVLFRDLSDNISYSAQHTLAFIRLVDNIIVCIVFAPYFFIALNVISYSRLADKFGLALILAVAALPLVLNLVGHDQFRWWSMVSMNLYILMWVSIVTSPAASVRLHEIFRDHRRIILVASGLFLFLGPLGATQGFAIYN